MEEEKTLDLNNLTDYQKVTLSNIAYLDISKEGLEKIQNGGLKLSDLEPYLSQADVKSSGDFPVGATETDRDLWKGLLALGFGDLVITDMTSNYKTGFQAMTFKDEVGNTGITYRGSDFDFEQGGFEDWSSGNTLEHFKGDSKHAEDALAYFEKHADPKGNNYIYGYSLGGNQVQHVFCEHYDSIQEAFSFNGNAISPKKLDTEEKIAAFNSDKFNCCIIEGDIIGMPKQNELYKNNVTCIKNKNGITTNFMNAHGAGAATYDKNGNFVTIPYDEMVKNVKAVYEKAEIGIQLEMFGKTLNIDIGPDNMWELVGMVQQVGIKSSAFCETVRDAVDALPEHAKKNLAMISDRLKLPMIGIITDPQESLQKYNNFIQNYGDGVIGKYLPGAEVLDKLQVFNIPAKFLKGSTEILTEVASEAYGHIADGRKTIFNLTKTAIVAPDELCGQIQEKMSELKDFNMIEWVKDSMEKASLIPMLKDATIVENVDQLKEWSSQVLSSFPSPSDAPKWFIETVKDGVENSWLVQTIQNKDLSLDSICGKAKSTVDKVKEIDLNDIKDAAYDKIESVKDFAVDTYDKTKSGLKTAGTYIYNKAEQTGEWIADKASDTKEWIADKADDVGDWVVGIWR